MCIYRNRFPLREHLYFGGLGFDDRLYASPAVEGVEGWDRQAMNYNGEEYEPVNDRSHGGGQIILLFGHSFTRFGKEVTSMLDIENRTDTYSLLDHRRSGGWLSLTDRPKVTHKQRLLPVLDTSRHDFVCHENSRNPSEDQNQ